MWKGALRRLILTLSAGSRCAGRAAVHAACSRSRIERDKHVCMELFWIAVCRSGCLLTDIPQWRASAIYLHCQVSRCCSGLGAGTILGNDQASTLLKMGGCRRGNPHDRSLVSQHRIQASPQRWLATFACSRDVGDPGQKRLQPFAWSIVFNNQRCDFGTLRHLIMGDAG